MLSETDNNQNIASSFPISFADDDHSYQMSNLIKSVNNKSDYFFYNACPIEVLTSKKVKRNNYFLVTLIKRPFKY